MTPAARKTAGLAILGATLGVPLLIAATSIWRGYVLTILWRWFAVPAFGLPPLSIPYAIGVALIVGYLARDIGVARQDRPLSASITASVLTPAFALLMGWIVTLFIR